MFEQLDKRATNSFLYSLTMFGTAGTNGMSLTDQLYLAQANVIRELADMGPCVVVGRCADHVLREYTNRYDFFITGSMEDRETRLRTIGDYEISGKSIPSALEKWINSARLTTTTTPARSGARPTTTICASTQGALA